MGRRKKYYSDEQKKEADKIKAEKYYLKNRELVKKKNLEKYHEGKYELSSTGSL